MDVAVEQLSGLALADENSSSDNLAVSILVGADCYWKVATGRIIHGRNGPTAVHTRLGWVLSGPDLGMSFDLAAHSTLCTHILNVTSISLQD